MQARGVSLMELVQLSVNAYESGTLHVVSSQTRQSQTPDSAAVRCYFWSVSLTIRTLSNPAATWRVALSIRFFRVAYSWPLGANMTSCTNKCITWPRRQCMDRATAIGNGQRKFGELWNVVPEIPRDRQADRQTWSITILRYLPGTK